MKRGLGDTPSRSTAGCLPVPLFNQKRRTRQPLTSDPLRNEPSTSSGSHNFSLTSFGWGTANPEGAELQKATSTGYTVTTKGWNRNQYTPFSITTDSRSGSGIVQKFENVSNSLKIVQQQKAPNNRNSAQAEPSQAHTSRGQWPGKPSTVARNLQDQGPAYKFNYNRQRSKMNEKQFDCVREEKSQEVSLPQIKIKEKNSLRILSAVIQSVRHWSQYTYRTPLLFEVLGTLDSAVTPGAYGAKNFLLRDGKETLPCVFYEIDRELPRLIRGRVHRCMGNYDSKRNIFKCVSVRPATAQEQNTFQDFVRIADVEMTTYVKTMNEM
ncbi:PREDICTED: spermatogenesis-associated protein 22 [Acanthisitta chloris]|uniref:spermatogenesis-associated protein 22 n=1 Tax=Acanthisitta chloris TaxID=57068 RepID=UPI0004F0C74D|nr:PREDICTED: spermatogenesis-associated protein 22 [Acanthisitta chloris]